MQHPDGERLTLREALWKYCDPVLLEKLASHQRNVTDAELARGRFFALIARNEFAQGGGPDTNIMHGNNYHGIRGGWTDVEADFVRRAQDGEFGIVGVQIEPELKTSPQVIPGAWLSIGRVNYLMNEIVVGTSRFGSVRVVPGSPVAPDGAESAFASSEPLTADAVRRLTDEKIFDLLEEYARRVVEDPQSRLTVPVKVSFIPIIRRKMAYRSMTGEMQSTLAAEAAALADWIKTKVNGHQIPKPATIENELREDYRRLKP